MKSEILIEKDEVLELVKQRIQEKNPQFKVLSVEVHNEIAYYDYEEFAGVKLIVEVA
jgi:hypothetical protein